MRKRRAGRERRGRNERGSEEEEGKEGGREVVRRMKRKEWRVSKEEEGE